MTHDILLKIILSAVGLLTTGALTYVAKKIVQSITTMQTVVHKVDGLAKQNE